MRIKKKYILIAIFAISQILFSCRSFLRRPYTIEKARTGETTRITRDLIGLPSPKEAIPVAVYKFRDQTGQYKMSDLGANWSTAVSQGTTTMLLKSIEDSKWFLSIERENVSNLMNERKIIRSSVAQYQNAKDPLPPLLFASIILEGGIVSYDASMLTGGIGLRYFGSGGDSQYRQDRVTVYLRAVSTSNGKILKTVYTSKTVLSQIVNSSIFKYVKLLTLLEGETGYTTNEPVQLALQEAIDKSVHSLIIEGLKDKLWESAEADKEKEKIAIANYEKSKEAESKIDVFGISNEFMRQPYSLNFNTNYSDLKNDFVYSNWGVGIGVGLNKRLSRNSELSLGLSYNPFRLENYKTNLFSVDILHNYSFQPYQKIQFFVGFGFGNTFQNSNYNKSSSVNLSVLGQAGLDVSLNNNFSFRGVSKFRYYINDHLDGRTLGNYNDNILSNTLGLNYYFDKKRLTKSNKSSK